ncbi:MAG: DUF58 domain-containing protein [Balneolaceae bacterium]|jgi:uncharacterized protein (DUF58 family)
MLLKPELLSQLAPLELRARKIVEGFISGLHKSPHHGFSVEFAEHRPYNPGDDFKHIDWKVYAKSERFYVKRYEEETNLRCYILLDTSSSMFYKYFGAWTKLRYGIHFGAALMYLMHRQRDACGLVTFGESIEKFIPAKSSYSHLRMLFTEFEQLLGEEKEGGKEQRKTASAKVIHEIAERLKHRSLVVILTDLFENVDKHDQLISSLKHLRHRKHEVLLFNVLEQKSERELDFPDRRLMMQDMETGDQIEVMPAQVREDYKQKVEELTHRFKMACSEFQIDFEELDTQSDFDLALLAYLNKRRRLG